jgi:hypothetical protein
MDYSMLENVTKLAHTDAQHRQCLMDEAESVISFASCPTCHTSLAAAAGSSTASPGIPVTYSNEGGIQENLDIFPNLKEEAYLASNPEARPARAYLTFCSEGDIINIIEMLRDFGENDEGEEEGQAVSPAQILRYQDPLNGQKSALHVAVENGQADVVWTLLWLASSLPDEAFPHEALGLAQSVGASRTFAQDGQDIRSLRNENGQTAADLAQQIGGQWEYFLAKGLLHA